MMMLRTLDPEKRARLRDYLHEALGVTVAFSECPGALLPVYLQNSYAFTCGRVFGSEYVFAAPAQPEGSKGPLWHAKQQEKLASTFGRHVVLAFDELTARDRSRLVQKRASFIVPFKQMYLPPAGVDFREWALAHRLIDNRPQTLEPFTPTTQLVLLYALLRSGTRELRTAELVHELDISAMSVSRAFKDLQDAGLVVREERGRERPARLAAEQPVVWEKAQPRLTDPVQARYSVPRRYLPGMLEAGLTALSHLSNLAAPVDRTVALGAEAWRGVRDEVDAESLDSAFGEPSRMNVEVWTYAPIRLAYGSVVDPLSLYLSLRDDPDERVQLALDQALKEIPWIRRQNQSEG